MTQLSDLNLHKKPSKTRQFHNTLYTICDFFGCSGIYSFIVSKNIIWCLSSCVIRRGESEWALSAKFKLYLFYNDYETSYTTYVNHARWH